MRRTPAIIDHTKLLIVPGLLLLLFFSGCNARVEGCLDAEAANFDVTADRNDRSQCSYPDMLLDVSYVYGDTSFSRSRLFENDMGQVFGIPALYILFSQFQLKGDEIGRKMVINQSNWLIEPDNVTSVANDFTFVDNLRFVYALGMWDETDFISELRFTVGVPDSLTPTSIDALAEDSKLNDTRTFYNEKQEQFATARFMIVRDSLGATPETIVVSSGPLSYDYQIAKDLRIGRADTIRVKVDFEKLFGNTDLSLDSAGIAAQLADRLESAISNNN